MNRERDRQTDRLTDILTERQTETDRQTDTERQTQRQTQGRRQRQSDRDRQIESLLVLASTLTNGNGKQRLPREETKLQPHYAIMPYPHRVSEFAEEPRGGVPRVLPSSESSKLSDALSFSSDIGPPPPPKKNRHCKFCIQFSSSHQR